jgi:hypothetical protein
MPKDTIECTLEFREVSSGTDDGPVTTKQLSRAVSVNWYKQTPDGARGGVYVGVEDQDGNIVQAQMSRAELNRLIRTLRRARDGAFGSDA